MAIIRRTREEARKTPFRFSAEQRATLNATSDEEVERLAAQDADNPEASDEDLARGATARVIRELRRRLALTQEQFAQAYEIPVGTVRDWEQGRREPDAPARAYIKAIVNAPQAVRDALGKVA